MKESTLMLIGLEGSWTCGADVIRKMSASPLKQLICRAVSVAGSVRPLWNLDITWVAQRGGQPVCCNAWFGIRVPD
jgi:hypothetical protein